MLRDIRLGPFHRRTAASNHLVNVTHPISLPADRPLSLRRNFLVMQSRILRIPFSLVAAIVFTVIAQVAGATTPVISTPPASKVARWLSSAALEVVATADGPLTYQWYLGTSGDTNLPVQGATGPLLVTPPMTATTSFWVRVANSGLSIDSPAATVTLIPLVQSTGVETLDLKAMGSDSYGQLGNGVGITGAASVSAGYQYSLFVKTDGTLWAMGSNSSGQLGLGFADSASRRPPTQVTTNVASVSAGRSHSLFVKIDGTLWAVGSNSSGQLGDGTTTTRTTPVQVGTNVVSAAAGSGHSLFVKTDGTLWAMGFNRAGELGDGSTINRSTLVQVATNVVSVSASNSVSLFVKTDGTLWAMGSNSSGQLGLGFSDNVAHSTPTQIATGVAFASAGSSHSLFVKTDGTLWGMGSNGDGRLGDLLTMGGPTPKQIATGVVSASAGDRHSVFAKTDGTLWGMGFNDDGRAGAGIGNAMAGPRQSATGAVFVSAGDSHSLVTGGPYTATFSLGAFGVRTGGGALVQRLWSSSGAIAPTVTGSGGRTFTGWDMPFTSITSTLTVTAQFAIATPPVVSTPPASGVVPWQGSTSLSVTATANGVLTYQWYRGTSGETSSPVSGATGPLLVTPALGATSSFWVKVMNSELSVDTPAAVLTVDAPPQPADLGSMGSNTYGQLGDGSTTSRATPVPTLSGLVSASAGSSHSLFVKSDRTLWAVGFNNYGQLGNGSTANRTTPTQITSDVVAASAANSHTAFVKTDGTLWTTGLNQTGQLGDGTQLNRSTPVQVDSNVVSVSTSQNNTLYVKTDGSLWGMGSGADGVSSILVTPVRIATGVTSVSAGSNHRLFLKSDRTLWGYGSNTNGQLGSGPSFFSSPIQIATDVASISAGASCTFFVKTDSTLWAMGLNSSGQLGDGTATGRASPIQIATGVASVSAGDAYTVFIKTDGTLWAMGLNSSGQLGDGTTTNRLSPVQAASRTNGVLFVDAGGSHSLFICPSRTVTFALGPYGTRYGGGALVQKVWQGAAALAPTINVTSGWNFTAWDTAFASVTTDLTVAAQYQSAYAIWAAGQGLNGANAEPTADADGDGVPNLLEYALGLDPTQNTGEVGKPVAFPVGDSLTLTYIRRTDAPDLTYVVEVSSDLVNWISGAGSTEPVSTTALDATRQVVVVRDLTPLFTAPARFIRLRVNW